MITSPDDQEYPSFPKPQAGEYIPFEKGLKNDILKARQSIDSLRSIISTLEARLEAKQFEVPDGWVLVPVEVTKDLYIELTYCCERLPPDDVWSCILNAAPKYEERGE